MNTALDMFRQMSVGFDDFWIPETKTTYPPYNIVKEGDNEFTIELALAGFSKETVEIFEEDNKLTIIGKQDNAQKDSKELVYNGLARRQFTRIFNLAPNVEVKDAQFKNGILNIRLIRELYKNQRTIKIS
jgi:molecular chaperone IbpA|tara:strand:- start:505 stop:894 length:390 start_codon:yes stop_codon:yes gene_type:complete